MHALAVEAAHSSMLKDSLVKSLNTDEFGFALQAGSTSHANQNYQSTTVNCTD